MAKKFIGPALSEDALRYDECVVGSRRRSLRLCWIVRFEQDCFTPMDIHVKVSELGQILETSPENLSEQIAMLGSVSHLDNSKKQSESTNSLAVRQTGDE